MDKCSLSLRNIREFNFMLHAIIIRFAWHVIQKIMMIFISKGIMKVFVAHVWIGDVAGLSHLHLHGCGMSEDDCVRIKVEFL